jgi:AraC-like DNA-binding protein
LEIFFTRLFQILTNGGIVLGVFVILLLNNKGVKKSRANVFLSVLLAAFTFSMLHILYSGDVILHFHIQPYFVGDPTFLVITPLLWFYVKELMGDRVRLALTSVLHFVPFAFICFCSIFLRSLQSDQELFTIIEQHAKLPVVFFWFLVVIQFSCYQFFIQRKWQQYQQMIKQEVSNTEDISITWVRFFLFVFLILNVFFLFSLFAAIHLDFGVWLWRAVGIVFSLSVFALGYKGILQREIFNLSLAERIGPLQKSGAPQSPDKEQVSKLIDFMSTHRPYLDPELSLSSLSKAVGVSRSQLSQLINDGVGENFYDFVNKYRVEEVKRLMTDPEVKNFSLLGLALEAGFKSKSSFNLIFKRFTGLTPTEYRKNRSQR